jgi:hypothetical protein
MMRYWWRLELGCVTALLLAALAYVLRAANGNRL